MILKGYNIVLKDEIIFGDIQIENGKIINITKLEKPKNLNDVRFILPGFIDQHIHGANGFDTMDGTLEALNEISKSIVSEGVTSFLPTTMTASSNDILKAVDNVSSNMKVKGAQILGVHLEGPFINKVYKGAQPEEHIQKIDINKLMKWNHNNIIKLITVAPELDNFDKLVGYAKDNNIVLSIGHTNATYLEVKAAQDKGINHFTHAYNAMRGFNHREAGVVGAMLTSNSYAELIADNIHVNQEAVKLLYQSKGVDNIILITDSIRAKGLNSDISELGGQTVYIKNNEARLASGSLAGSILKFDDAIRNIKNILDLSLIDIAKMSSLNAARNLKVDHLIGSIEKGKQANLVILNKNLEVLTTIVKGEIVYENKNI